MRSHPDLELPAFTDIPQYRAFAEVLRRLLHDVNNSISAIEASSSFLVSVDVGADKRRQLLELISAESSKLRALSLRIGPFCRFEPGLRKEALDLAHLVRRVVVGRKAGFEALGVRLLAQVPPDPVPAETDAAMLELVMNYLLALRLQRQVGTSDLGVEVLMRLSAEGGKAFIELLPEPPLEAAGAEVPAWLGLAGLMAREAARELGARVEVRPRCRLMLPV